MDRIECLRAFVRAMEGQSFTHAAKELGISQPAVSKAVAVLEQEFGSQLFLRTTRRLRPTAEARRIYDLARQILNTYEAARASAKAQQPKPSGTLRLSVPSSFGRHYLMPIVVEYMRDYPEVRLDIRFSEQIVDLVEEGFELALRIGELRSSSLMARRVGTIHRYLVATPAYLEAHAALNCPSDLKHHRCIAYARHVPASQWIFESELGRHVETIAPSILVDDADAMKEAVLQHLGIAILPAWIALDSIRRGDMEVLLPDHAIPGLPLHAVFPETQWMSLRARSFLDLVIARSDWFNEARSPPRRAGSGRALPSGHAARSAIDSKAS